MLTSSEVLSSGLNDTNNLASLSFLGDWRTGFEWAKQSFPPSLKTDIESLNVNLSDDIIEEINEVQKLYPNPCP